MSTMRAQLAAAALAHPKYPEFAHLVGKGLPADRCAGLVGDSGQHLLFEDHGTRWRVRNNPARLTALSENEVSKCPGFTGRKTPRPALRASWRLFKHRELGFSLLLDDHLAYGDLRGDAVVGARYTRGASGCNLRLGKVVLKCRLPRGATQGIITGHVPESWLVDLNAGDITPDPEPEAEDADLWLPCSAEVPS